jgi:RHS repeat-associated protein
VVAGHQGHLPFGEDFGESGNQEKHHFTSYERDSETSSDYATNRQFSQNVGRFMRVDALLGCIKSPQTLNRYAYVQNDPLNRVDPEGLEDAGKIPIEQEDDYDCKKFPFDTCKDIGEKIRDLTVSVAIRFSELDPDTESYFSHLKVWNEQRNLLNKCISKFGDKGCGDDDLPKDFKWEKALKEARKKAPRLTGFGDFLRRGGWVPVGLAICTVCPECCAVFLPGAGPAPAPEPVPADGLTPGGGITMGNGGWYADDPEICEYCPECCEDDPDLMLED